MSDKYDNYDAAKEKDLDRETSELEDEIEDEGVIEYPGFPSDQPY